MHRQRSLVTVLANSQCPCTSRVSFMITVAARAARRITSSCVLYKLPICSMPIVPKCNEKAPTSRGSHGGVETGGTA
ncbi:hypothetical protein VTO73DRAFT_895 [Trametes versicolor]